MNVGGNVVSLDIFLHILVNTEGGVAQLVVASAVDVLPTIEASPFAQSIRAGRLLAIFTFEKVLELLMDLLTLKSA